MSLFLRSWPLLLALGLSACALPGAGPTADACAPAAMLLDRQMAGSGVAMPQSLTGDGPSRPQMIAALRLANLQLLMSQEAASRLFECRSAQARTVREDQAADRIWLLTAEIRIARIRAVLRGEIEAALEVSERIGAADAALIAAASAPALLPAPSTAMEARQAAELRGLIATNAARRESLGSLVLLAGQVTDIEMDRREASR